MSQRNRSGRGLNRNSGSTHGEEVQLWETSKEKISEIVSLINEDTENLNEILKLDKAAAEAAKKGDSPTINQLFKMETRCRAGVKKQDNIIAQVKAQIESLQVIRAIQHAKEQVVQEVPSGPNTTSRASASRTREREQTAASLYEFDGSGESPVPSPIGGGSSRRFGDRGSNRDSLPPTTGDGDVPGSSGTPAPSTGSAGGGAAAAAAAASAAAAAASGIARSKITFAKGDEVAFKPKVANDQHSDWILGEVAAVLGEGKSRRYKVLDVDPDEQSTQKEYRSSASSMIPITPDDQAQTLGNWETGKVVLALYPQTTTFYKAEVMSTAPDGRVNLRFEGENDSTTMQQVERRFVIEFRG